MGKLVSIKGKDICFQDDKLHNIELAHFKASHYILKGTIAGGRILCLPMSLKEGDELLNAYKKTNLINLNIN